jgi:FeS assembly SUF system protein
MFGLFKKKNKQDVFEPLPEPEADETLDGPVAEPVTDDEVNHEALAKIADDLQRAEKSDFVHPQGVEPGTPSGIPGFDYTPVDPDEEFKATAGKPLADGTPVASEEAVVEALREVYDPEIPVNIYDLGLIYGLSILEKGDIKIDMSLTAPGCPVAGEMPGMVARAVEGVEGTGEIEVLLVWEPQWTPERMSEDAKLALGMG